MSENSIDWRTAGFKYRATDYMFVAYYRDGKWNQGELIPEGEISIHPSSTALHYGQECFEGMKAYRRKDGRVQLFRPDENGKRLSFSAKRLAMPEVPLDLFLKGVKEAVKANIKYVPPYGSGGTLYIRPMYIGTGENLGVGPSKEYMFIVFTCPVGSFFKDKLQPVSFLTTEYDRAAPMGTGKAKAGGNYAGSIAPRLDALEKGFSDCVYLDPATHTKIEEIGSANFFGIRKDGTFVTPESPSILNSITKISLKEVARDLGHPVRVEDVPVDSLDQFVEAGACGTAAVITPISFIEHEGKQYHFYSDTEAGPVTTKLYDTLTSIQYGDIEDPYGWTHIIEE